MHGDEHASQKETASALRKETKQSGMRSTKAGRAWSFSAEVKKMHARVNAVSETVKKAGQYIETFAMDNMVYFAEDLIACQEEFEGKSKPSIVTVGYHYTKKENLDGISRHGLMSGPEREANGVSCVAGGGIRYGPGIYTGNNPYAFQCYGDVGLILAVLQGETQRVGNIKPAPRANIDTVIGNKYTDSSLDWEHDLDEIVLKRTSQCIPLICFSTNLIAGQVHKQLKSEASQLMWRIQQKLQYIIDEFLNQGREVEPDLVHLKNPCNIPRIPRRIKFDAEVLVDVSDSAHPIYSSSLSSQLKDFSKKRKAD